MMALAVVLGAALTAGTSAPAVPEVDAGPTPPPPALLDVTWEGEALLTGRLEKLDVKATAPIASLSGTFDKRKVIAFPASADGAAWIVLAPVHVEARPKPAQLALSAVLMNGKKLAWKKPVAVAAAPYDERQLTVSRQFVRPSAKQRARAAREAKSMQRALATATPQRLWRGSFAVPTAGPETSPFGTRRTYYAKGSKRVQKRSRHLGLDLDGKTGDAIVAANRGRVALAEDRFYSGGTVVLDHGEGLFTMYFHMSRIDVKPGDVVEKGQGLGAVGATGQVTGPHLHFSVKAAGLYQDPKYVLALDLSADALDAPAPAEAPQLSPK